MTIYSSQTFGYAHSNPSRMVFLDTLKGLAILLMVTGHGFVFLTGNASNPINDFVITWHMPLFAFISGFLSFNITTDTSTGVRKVRKRIIQQLLPTIAFCLIWTATLSTATWQETLDSMWKGGYWFTFIAVELSALYFIIQAIGSSGRNSARIQCWIFSLIIIGTPLLEKALFSCGITLSTRWCVPNLFRLAPFFFAGCLTRASERTFAAIISRRLIGRAIVITLILGTIAIGLTGIYGHHSVFIRIAACFVPVLALFSLFFQNKDFIVNHVRSLRYLNEFGRRSLEIYLLHFFFLCTAGYAIDLSNPVLCNALSGCMIYVMIFIIAIPAAYLCIATCRVLDMLGLYRYIFLSTRTSADKASKRKQVKKTV